MFWETVLHLWPLCGLAAAAAIWTAVDIARVSRRRSALSRDQAG